MPVLVDFEDVQYEIKKKCPEVETLSDYRVTPDKSFWDTFPFNPLPDRIECDINVVNLSMLIEDCKSWLTQAQFFRALSSVNDLLYGASSCQKNELPPCSVSNSNSSFKHGPEITDSVAYWTKKKFAAGPFESTPVKNFRSNPLIAIDQGEKIRPVLNVSLPEKNSFNDNVDDNLTEKVYMSTAKSFSYSVIDAGKSAIMCKFDFTDAYKNVPCKIFDLRLQGFSWLGKFFIETRQIFGARTSVANFDKLGNTILALATAKLSIPKKFLFRTLDDVPFVAPANSDWSFMFVNSFVHTCSLINIGLAKDCAKLEKAFKNSTSGKVLGVFFNTETLNWCIPRDKKEKALRCIDRCLRSEIQRLEDFQELMGRLNSVGQMSPFMRGFKAPLNAVLKDLMNGIIVSELPEAAVSDLGVWHNFLQDEKEWHPIAVKYTNIPLGCKSFTSDAAGCPENSCDKKKLGCGNVGFHYDGTIMFAFQLFWTREVLELHRDKKESRMGNKTTTLEFLGVILPFILIPEMLVNQNIEVKVDNTGCYFGWLNKQVTGDAMASILVRSLHLICSYLGSRVHITHLPRDSSWDSKLVDRLSREKTTTNQDEKLLKSFETRKIPDVLEDWMAQPTEDWNLPVALLNVVKNRVEG